MEQPREFPLEGLVGFSQRGADELVPLKVEVVPPFGCNLHQDSVRLGHRVCGIEEVAEVDLRRLSKATTSGVGPTGTEMPVAKARAARSIAPFFHACNSATVYVDVSLSTKRAHRPHNQIAAVTWAPVPTLLVPLLPLGPLVGAPQPGFEQTLPTSCATSS